MRKAILAGAMGSGLLVMFGGVVFALTLLLLAPLSQRSPGVDQTQASALALTFGAVGLGLGAILAWAGWRGLRGMPGGSLRFPRWGWWLLALALVLGAGQLALARDIGWLAAILHVAASASGAGLVMAWTLGAARRVGGSTTARPAISSLAWGGLGGVGLAMLAEALLVLLALVLALIYFGSIRPDGLERLQGLVLGMQGGEGLDLSALAPLARSPLTWGVALIAGCVIVPLIEELAKSLAVPLIFAAGRRINRLDGFLFGAAAGVGFALFEGAGNGSLALASDQGWWGVMLVRVGAAAMHALAAGIGGLAWQVGLSEKRWPRARWTGRPGAGASRCLESVCLGTHPHWAGRQRFRGQRHSAGRGGHPGFNRYVGRSVDRGHHRARADPAAAGAPGQDRGRGKG